MDGWRVEWINGLVEDGWMNGLMIDGGWMDGCMNGLID